MPQAGLGDRTQSPPSEGLYRTIKWLKTKETDVFKGKKDPLFVKGQQEDGGLSTELGAGRERSSELRPLLPRNCPLLLSGSCRFRRFLSSVPGSLMRLRATSSGHVPASRAGTTLGPPAMPKAPPAPGLRKTVQAFSDLHSWLGLMSRPHIPRKGIPWAASKCPRPTESGAAL